MGSGTDGMYNHPMGSRAVRPGNQVTLITGCLSLPKRDHAVDDPCGQAQVVVPLGRWRFRFA